MSESREPLDLRLVPAAVLSWCAAVAVTAGGASAWPAVGAALVLGLLGLLIGGRRHLAAAGGGLLLGAVAVAVVVASGAAQQASGTRGGVRALIEDGAVVSVTGVLRTDGAPVPTPWDPGAARSRCVLAVTSIRARGTTRPAGARLQVVVAGSARDLVRGTTVRVQGRLAPSELGGAGVRGTISAAGVEVLRPAVGVDAVVARLRAGLLDLTAGLAPQARGLVPGMVLGDTSRLPADLASDMRAVGLTHLTAVSGTHVAVVVLVVGSLAVRLRAPRVVRAAAAGAAIGGFVLLVHPEPSVLRAALMGVLGIGGLLLGRASSALPALLGTVVALLAVDPSLARSIGFTLSVAATAAIVLLAVPAGRLLPTLPRPIVHAVAVPLAAQSACGPVLVLIDPAVSLWAVPANVLAAPAVLPATVLGLLGTLMAPVSMVAAGLLARASGLATGWIAAVAGVAAGLPGSRLGWTPGTPGAVGLGALTALAWLLLARALRARRDSTDADEPRPSTRGRVGAIVQSAVAARGRLGPCPPPRAGRPRPP